MLGLAAVVATLLRFRARACLVLACIAAMLCATTNASALERVQTKTRVWDFSFAQPLNTWLERSASPRTHPENQLARAEPASGSPHAARAIPKIHMGQQGKHILGHPNFIQGRSVLRADPARLAQRAGTGTPVNNVARGQPGFKERVDFHEVIGDFVKDGVATPTSKGIIHYGKEGIHIVPAAP